MKMKLQDNNSSMTLSNLVKRYELIINEMMNATYQIKECAVEFDLEQLMFETDNRDRLISMLSFIQAKIDEHINVEVNLKDEDIKSVKLLNDRLKKIVYDIAKIDEIIIDLLSQDKERTREEISRLFQSRQKIKGYNLNNVR